MRQASVLYDKQVTGKLIETDDGEYLFQYEPAYVEGKESEPITLTMPLRLEPYTDKRLFAFFEGLIPEGWLLDIASKNWKLNPNDRMGLLLACCRNCIGAVSIHAIEEKP
jgi:serine/threonine-protein kinase HipA